MQGMTCHSQYLAFLSGVYVCIYVCPLETYFVAITRKSRWRLFSALNLSASIILAGQKVYLPARDAQLLDLRLGIFKSDSE